MVWYFNLTGRHRGVVNKLNWPPLVKQAFVKCPVLYLYIYTIWYTVRCCYVADGRILPILVDFRRPLRMLQPPVTGNRIDIVYFCSLFIESIMTSF